MLFPLGMHVEHACVRVQINVFLFLYVTKSRRNSQHAPIDDNNDNNRNNNSNSNNGYIYIYMCVYVCMYVCTYVRTYVCMYVSLSIYRSIYRSIDLSIYLSYLSHLILPYLIFILSYPPIYLSVCFYVRPMGTGSTLSMICALIYLR